MNTFFKAVAVFALTAVSTLAMAAGEVSLIKARSVTSTYRGYWHYGRFEAQVANLGANKNVAAYIKKADGSWYDFPMTFVRTAGTKEVWAADFNLYTMPDAAEVIEFAVKYQVNGLTYWDNNNWSNYKLVRGGGALLGAGVNVSENFYAPEINVSASQTTWGSHITLRNIAYTKNVNVVYSTDNWATTKVVAATYDPYFWFSSYSNIANPNAMGFEEWRFTLDIGNATEIQYAISYTVNGQTYWDNNFGRNYHSRIIRM